MSDYNRAFQALVKYVEDRACHDKVGMIASRERLDAELSFLPDNDVTRDLADALREA